MKKMDEKALADYIDDQDGVRKAVDAMLAVLKNEYLPQDGGPSHSDKLKAAEALMARRLGKPRESVEVTQGVSPLAEVPTDALIAWARMNEDERKAALAAVTGKKLLTDGTDGEDD